MLTRQNLPTIDRTKYAPASSIAQGAYVLADAAEDGAPDVILIGQRQRGRTGARGARAPRRRGRALARRQHGVLAALPAPERGLSRGASCRLACRRRLAVETGVTIGWERWVGDGGEVIGLDHYGASAPAGILFEQFGFTADNVYQKAKALLDRTAE